MNKKLQTLSNRSAGIMEVVNDLVESWSYDLSKRKPGIAYVDDKGNPITNLDAACFLSYLAGKRGVINVGTYKGMRARQHTEGEVIVSSTNRHGKLNYLTSNQKVWSFGFNFKDFNVMTADTVGKDRSFAMQGMDGAWHEGWDVIELLPTGLAAEVMEALTDDNGKAHFEFFIHPLRWVSIFGENFRIAKFAADYRIPDRLKFLKAELKRLREALLIEPKEWPRSEKDPSRPKKFWAYESFIDGVTLTGEYTPFPTTQEGYDEAMGEKRRLESLQRTLRFHVRASEFAWWQHLTKGMELYTKDGKGNVVTDDLGDAQLSDEPVEWVVQGGKDISKPVWAKDKTWLHGVKEPGAGARSKKLFVAMEMEEGVSYRFRVMHKMERVAIEK